MMNILIFPLFCTVCLLKNIQFTINLSEIERMRDHLSTTNLRRTVKSLYRLRRNNNPLGNRLGWRLLRLLLKFLLLGVLLRTSRRFFATARRVALIGEDQKLAQF